jgi:hypothetical protein
MVFSNIRWCALLEVMIVLLQVAGVVSLCLARLMAGTRWAERGRVGFIITLIGLGIGGALCGGVDSEFALFAGGTMTFLLIGMTIGNGGTDTIPASRLRVRAEANLAS